MRGRDVLDEQVGAAPALKEDSERRKENGEDELDDVAVFRGLASFQQQQRMEKEEEEKEKRNQ